MKRVILKEGPSIFIRNVIAMEILAIVFFYSISFLQNYELIFKTIRLDTIARYDIFLVIFFSIFQISYLMALFFNWYFRYFEISEREIVRRSGLIFRRRKSVPMLSIVAVETTQSPLDRLTNHATIIFEHNNGKVTKIRNVADYEETVSIVKQIIENSTKRRIHRHGLQVLTKEGEGPFLEFKQTLRYDLRKKEVSKDIERAIAKTIVGFMNAEGGTLVIGVDDEGTVTGLKNDYESLGKKNRDGFENHLSMIIKKMIGLKFANYVHTSFDFYNGNEACIISIEPSHKPAYLHNGDGKEEFFVRVGNSTQPFSMSEAEEYIKTRWK
jgi:membrane protein YdbS with pleckstrin-like domain